jgi:formin 2/WAS/WASL-interacting protein
MLEEDGGIPSCNVAEGERDVGASRLAGETFNHEGGRMGFLDKAKKMAEQAQTKLDEVQKQFNEGQSGSGGSQPPPVEYDQHGRPIRSEPPAEPVAPPAAETAPPPAATAEPVGPRVGGSQSPRPPHGDPLGEQTPPPPAPPAAPTPDPAAPPANEDDPYAPPKLTGGDPLAG